MPARHATFFERLRGLATLDDLRDAVDDLPLSARVAMLTGLRRERIIAGAYTDRAGGVCPVMAAYRQGSHVPFKDFARMWDGYTRARRKSPHTASMTHKRTLMSVLRLSIERDLRAFDDSIPDAEAVRDSATALVAVGD